MTLIRRERGRTQRLIASALREAQRPLGAYDLMHLLKDEGVSSPTTVYRALTRLTEAGLIHRLETLNAFTLCANGCHAGSAVFAICEECGAVNEFSDRNVVKHLAEWGKGAAFSIQNMTIELRGICCSCAGKQSVSIND
jgi:Fur family transcriptional regulator, zinc uptake regulator